MKNTISLRDIPKTARRPARDRLDIDVLMAWVNGEIGIGGITQIVKPDHPEYIGDGYRELAMSFRRAVQEGSLIPGTAKKARSANVVNS